MYAYLAPQAIATLALSAGIASVALASDVPGYTEPSYLNYNYARQTQASSTVPSAPSEGYVEPGYLNYRYAPDSSAPASITLYGQSAAAGSGYVSSSGSVEPGYLNYRFAPAL